MQAVILDEPGSNCETKFFSNISLTKKNKSLFLYRYVLDPSSPGHDSSGLVLLTKDNIGRYVGKTVKMRSPMFCKGNRICNKCAGEQFYRMGVENAGLYTFSMSGKLMNISMKKMHDSTLTFNKFNIENVIKKR